MQVFDTNANNKALRDVLKGVLNPCIPHIGKKLDIISSQYVCVCVSVFNYYPVPSPVLWHLSSHENTKINSLCLSLDCETDKFKLVDYSSKANDDVSHYQLPITCF